MPSPHVFVAGEFLTEAVALDRPEGKHHMSIGIFAAVRSVRLMDSEVSDQAAPSDIVGDPPPHHFLVLLVIEVAG